MSRKVVELVRSCPPPPDADPDIVSLATELLRMAKAGELRSVAVAADHRDGGVSIATAYANGCQILTLLGVVHKLADRVSDDSDAVSAPA